MIVFAQDARHELCFAFRIRLTVVSTLLCQATFQVLVPLREAVVAAKRVAKSDLLGPPLVSGLDQVQVRLASLSRRVWLDEEAPPRSAIQFRRHMAPTVRNKPLRCLINNSVQVSHRGHQVHDRLCGKPRNSRRPNVLNPIDQPRCEQTGQLLTLRPCPNSPSRVVRTDLCPLVRPCRGILAHQATLVRLCDSQRSSEQQDRLVRGGATGVGSGVRSRRGSGCLLGAACVR
jgi:hypothetical protein